MKALNYRQIFIGGFDKNLHVYIYLKDFTRKFAEKVFDSYIEKYRAVDLDGIHLTFLDTQIAEGYLELINERPGNKDFLTPLAGTKFYKGIYNYKLTDRKLEEQTVFA
jgi:hypothetical protein